MKLESLLKGCDPVRKDGRVMIQTILNMQLIPLTTDQEYSHNIFANPLSDQVLVSTRRGYGALTIKNETDQPVIIPAHSVYMTDYPAQDHSTSKAVYIGRNTNKNVDDSRCVESSQGGDIKPSVEGLHKKSLPYHLKEVAFSNAGEEGYNKIWPNVAEFNQSVNAQSGAHIKYYFSKYERRINEFIAHFERPENLIGVIVLIDGEIVAIDKFPSFQYGAQVWDLLVRDCYGSLAIVSEIQNKEPELLFTSQLSKSRKKSDESVPNFLQRVLDKTRKKLGETVLDRIEEVMDITFSETSDDTDQDFTSKMLDSEGYIGQVIAQSDFNHLVSIVKKDKFNPEMLRKANVYRKQAKEQRPFSI